MRNSFHKWIAELPKKAVVNNKKKVVKQEKVTVTTGAKEHSKVAEVKKLDESVPKENKTKEELHIAITKTIPRKMIHENEIFISAEQLMYLVVFYPDWQVKGKEQINENLQNMETDGILKIKVLMKYLHIPFDKILGESWNLNIQTFVPDALEHVHITKHILMNYADDDKKVTA